MIHTFTEKYNKNKKNNLSSLFNRQVNFPSPKFTSFHSGNILQRKCACGYSKNHEGECEEGKKKKLSLQRKPLNYLQPKLTLGPPDDIYEKEADSMAEKVMRMSIPENINLKHNEEAEIQRKESSNNEILSTAPPIVNEVINSAGKPLDEETLAFMEPRFGFDFSNVRIHDDDKAKESANAVNALAYTTGNKIVFNQNQFNSTSKSGKHLIAHELTHIIQQNFNVQPKVIRRWGMDNAPIGDPERHVGLKERLKGITAKYIDIPSIKIKRKHIHLTGDDKYGHWWTEMKGSESYGWWPKYPVGLKETLFGTVGELNGQTSFGGTPTTDPHHGENAEEELNVKCTDPSKSESIILNEMRTFAKTYSGEWRWTFGWGQNCHTFQKEMLSNSNLIIV